MADLEKTLGFGWTELTLALDEGDVRVQVHPEFPELRIYNYTEDVQFKNKWNKITLACRGLILNHETHEIVARPWEKFFNLGQMDNRIDSLAPVEVTDKMDGSLGILYRLPDGEWAIATRGSFASEQAVEANKIWSESYSHLDIPEDSTFLFEILVPWNRIVVQYDYDSEYLQQGRGILSQGSSRDDTRQHLYSTEEWLEDLSSVQERGSEARQTKARGETQGECSQVAFSEQGEGQRTQSGSLREDSISNSGSQERPTVHGLSTDVSSGVHGLRPPTGNRKEIQYRTSEESSSTESGDGEVRVGVRELSQNQDVHYTPGNLVLLGAVNKERGFYYGPNTAAGMLYWPGPVTESWMYERFVDAISFPDRQGKEGVVIRSGSKMVKLKQADYVELHRIVTNLSPKTIWQQLEKGRSIGDICAEIPDEFHKYVEEIGVELFQQASEITLAARIEFGEIMYHLDNPSRRKFAELATKSKNAKYLFLLLDGKEITDVVWQSIKPRGDVQLVKED